MTQHQCDYHSLQQERYIMIMFIHQNGRNTKEKKIRKRKREKKI